MLLNKETKPNQMKPVYEMTQFFLPELLSSNFI